MVASTASGPTRLIFFAPPARAVSDAHPAATDRDRARRACHLGRRGRGDRGCALRRRCVGELRELGLLGPLRRVSRVREPLLSRRPQYRLLEPDLARLGPLPHQRPPAVLDHRLALRRRCCRRWASRGSRRCGSCSPPWRAWAWRRSTPCCGCSRCARSTRRLRWLPVATGSFVFWASVPETFAFGGLSILLALVIFAVRRDSLPALVLANVLAMSFTITNWMVACYGTLTTQPLRKAIRIFAIAFAITAALWMVQRLTFSRSGAPGKVATLRDVCAAAGEDGHARVVRGRRHRAGARALGTGGPPRALGRARRVRAPRSAGQRGPGDLDRAARRGRLRDGARAGAAARCG